MLQLIEVAQARGRGAGFGHSSYGFGAPVSDFLAFANGQSTPASFVGGVGAPNIVYCNKDRAARPQCMLNKSGDAAKAPIRDMQRAIDRIINAIPTNGLAGRTLKGQMPNGDGTTSEKSFPVPSNLSSPIARGGGGGYDGIVGDTSTKYGVMAMTLAGMLKKFPNPGISLAFVSPTRNDIYAEYSKEIADYLNDVADHMPELLAAFNERGNVPVQTHLDVETIPFVVPQVAQESRLGPILFGAAAMVGLTTIGALASGKHAPRKLYAEPALGRKHRRGY
jgi:hypothetical protein